MTTELGRLVSELINRTHECALAPDGYGCDAYLAQVAAEKALLEYVEKREQQLREGVEKLASEWERNARNSYMSGGWAAIKLRALLK